MAVVEEEARRVVRAARRRIKRRRLPKHLATVDGVEGMISLEEADLLFRMARDLAEGCILEVGSYRGRSTTALGLGSLAGTGQRVYAIDPHEQFVGLLGGSFGWRDREAFMRNISRTGCAEAVRLVELSSEMIASTWQLPIGLLFLDGDHSYGGGPP